MINRSFLLYFKSAMKFKQIVNVLDLKKVPIYLKNSRRSTIGKEISI